MFRPDVAQQLREMVLLLNAELRRLYNMDPLDVKMEDSEEALDRLMVLFGLEKCNPGKDSWDTYAEIRAEHPDDFTMEYEDYIEDPELSPWALYHIDE